VAGRAGLKAVDMFKAVADGRIKALWIMATNPAVSMPDASAVEAAIASCPFVVVSEVMAETDTARHADVKLPSLAWGEKDGTVTNSERRISRQRAFLSAPGEARADWWQMAEVAKRMGYQAAFDWIDSAAVFVEHAALTAFENQGTRDLDLSALVDLSKAEFEALEPFQWPQRGTFVAGRQTRFFAKGGFYTPNGKAQCVPVDPPPLAGEHNTRLNTGRVRDQWHTMTRTAKAVRLNSHIAEPYCELNPADANRLNIGPADLVQLSSGGHDIVVRALVTPDQPPGSVFVPMHWNDQFAGRGRVNTVVNNDTDPLSGQPALKGSEVTVAKASMHRFGFAVMVEKPCTKGLSYWAMARVAEGWQLEFALDHLPEKMDSFFATVTGQKPCQLLASDHTQGLWRAAQFDGSRLVSAMFLGATPVSVSRPWAVGQLTHSFDDPNRRWQALAGRSAADAPDKGAIVCACMGVGVNEIIGAVRTGCHSVEAIGHATDAGTNCGSCRAEITEIIHAHRLVAAE
ncbi:MAG: molybdopterin-dependent oxidoreductase, partial [Pseudomonadota bacterium]